MPRKRRCLLLNQQGYHLFFVQDKGWLVTSPGAFKVRDNDRSLSIVLAGEASPAAYIRK
jgi:hypothetical protein